MIPIAPRFATVHSLISAWARCGRVDVKASHLRGNRASLLSHDYSLGVQAAKLEAAVFKGHITATQLVDDHSHVPLYASLMSPLSALGWREHLLAWPTHRDVWARGVRKLSTVEAPTLRRCPICVEDDRGRYGCAHWRVFHQWPLARHCAEHGALLESRCVRCHVPFVRGNEPRLADDPCPECGDRRGTAPPHEPPAAYWPLLHRMHGLLTGTSPPVSDIVQVLALKGIVPAVVGSPKTFGASRVTVDRALQQWDVTSLSDLATSLAVNWIWFNEAERAGHLKEWPPLLLLALMVASQQQPPDFSAGTNAGISTLRTTGSLQAIQL